MLLIIPGTMPGLNEMIDEARIHRMRSAEQKKLYTELVMWYAKKAKIPKMERVSLNITWYEPNRRRDPDNVAGGGTKFILDGMVLAGVLDNDGWKQVKGIKHDFEVDRGRPRVEIEIMEERKGNDG